jgi:hypothetical protein
VQIEGVRTVRALRGPHRLFASRAACDNPASPAHLFSTFASAERETGEPAMFDFKDLFQWDRFITPTIIKTFYWLVIALVILFGISGVFTGLMQMAISPFGGFIVVLSALAGVVVGVVFSRIAAEFVLIIFRINEHLGAIREQVRDRPPA